MKNIIQLRGPSKSLVGMKFVRLVVKSFAGYIGRRTAWKCKCSCGKTHIATGNALLRRNVKSCGCLKAEKFPGINIKHGFSFRRKKEPIYLRWKSMCNRCQPTNKKAKKNYYDRGIRVCEEWRDFTVFLRDMGDSFRRDLTIHRIDNDLGYSKYNCKWATTKEQSRFRTNSHPVTINGVTKNVVDWVGHFNISLPTFYQRVHKGMSDFQALTTPLLQAPTRGKRSKA